MNRVVGTAIAVALLVLTAAPPAPAQAPVVTTLAADLARLKKEVEGVQRELREIKRLLNERLDGRGAEARSVVVGVGDGPFKGVPDARVTLVEFTDYQCPFCARHHRTTVPRLMEAYVNTGKLKYVVRDFPLASIHPAAVKAAEAPHCAADGGKYWQMHERLFANPRAVSPDDLVQHARALGLDPRAFAECLETGKYTARVSQAQAAGERAGVRGTPVFFLGLTEPGSGTITSLATIRGAQPFARFEEAIEKVLATPR
ncbi:MAG TPA: DsbA family protein [Methylomirabilota bacterium]|nr:DsbA family protein [Methylomirabilota bacterium]